MDMRTMERIIGGTIRGLVLLLWLTGGAWAQAAGRDLPAPRPAGHDASAELAEDNAPPALPAPRFDPRDFAEQEMLRRLAEAGKLPRPDADKTYYDDLGGDDVTVAELPFNNSSLDIAGNGDIYLATNYGDIVDYMIIKVYRSRDGGTTWEPWGTFGTEAGPAHYWDPCILVVEGVVDRCYLAYDVWDGLGSHHAIQVARSELSSTTGSWLIATAMNEADVNFSDPRLATDASNFSSFYLYLVATGFDTNRDIWFTRSTDQGLNFEAEYRIASLAFDDRGYWYPDVSYGYGGYVHVSWHFESTEQVFDSSARYRRVPSFASGGSAAWEPMQTLTSTGNGTWERGAHVAASAASTDVLLAYDRLIWHSATDSWSYLECAARISHDQGATFGPEVVLDNSVISLSGLEQQPGTGDWILAGRRSDSAAIQRAPAADPTAFAPAEMFADARIPDTIAWTARAALDPSRDHRVGASWIVAGTDPNTQFFDAEWRRDEGWPNLEAGFPLALDHTPLSPPALVDLDGDGDLEIVYGDSSQRIQARHHNGASVTHWPVNVGRSLADGPVAVAKLKLDDTLFIVAGTTDGRVVAYDVDGSPMPGWPYDTGTGAPTYVSIGALGGPYPRTVVVASGELLTFRNWRGQLPAGAYYRTSAGHTYDAPCAIGDVDGDGVAEVVCGRDNLVFAVKMKQAASVFGRTLPSNVSDAVTLGDLDLDGEAEIIVPTVNGTLYAMDENGADFPGSWPFTSDTATPLTSAAIAQCLGAFEPEVAVAARNYAVHLLWDDGAQQSGYPVHTGTGWYIYGAPVMGRVFGTSSDVVIGARDNQGWSWDNFGAVNPGWPRGFADHVHVSPAMGDLDGDGSTEIVFLTLDAMVVFDLEQVPATYDRLWAMYGHDPQRTGCADCPEDVATPVPGDATTITKVSFVTASPNPQSGPTLFRYELPLRAVASLEIYDVRGHRVRTVVRSERDPGRYTADWDGRDGDGRDLPSGVYLARLTVQGPGVDEKLTRKVVRLR